MNILTHPDFVARQFVLDAARQAVDIAFKSSSGNNGGMDPWQQSVENRLKQLHEDITSLSNRLTDKIDHYLLFSLAAMASGWLILAGMLAKGFHWF